MIYLVLSNVSYFLNSCHHRKKKSGGSDDGTMQGTQQTSATLKGKQHNGHPRRLNVNGAGFAVSTVWRLRSRCPRLGGRGLGGTRSSFSTARRRGEPELWDAAGGWPGDQEMHATHFATGTGDRTGRNGGLGRACSVLPIGGASQALVLPVGCITNGGAGRPSGVVRVSPMPWIGSLAISSHQKKRKKKNRGGALADPRHRTPVLCQSGLGQRWWAGSQERRYPRLVRRVATLDRMPAPACHGLRSTAVIPGASGVLPLPPEHLHLTPAKW